MLKTCTFRKLATDSALVLAAKSALNAYIPPQVWTRYWQEHGLQGKWENQTEETLVAVLAWVETIRENPLLQVLDEIGWDEEEGGEIDE